MVSIPEGMIWNGDCLLLFIILDLECRSILPILGCVYGCCLGFSLLTHETSDASESVVGVKGSFGSL